MLTVNDKRKRPRVEFTPAGYKYARRRLDMGYYGELATMLKEASVDSHVAGCLTARQAGYKRPYSLVPFDDTGPDAERAAWMDGVLQGLRLRELMDALFEARLYFFSVVDFVWEVQAGRQVPVDWLAFEQHHFRYETVEMDGGGKQRILRVDFGGKDLREIEDTALVAEHRRPAIMLPVLRDYILSEFGFEAFAAFLETFGEPFIIATHPPNATPEQKAEIDEALATFSRSTRGRKPAGTDFQIVESKRGTGDHAAFLDMVHKGISISLLGHANAVESGGGLQIGDHPVGFEVKFEIGTDDCYFLEPALGRLVRLIYDRNFADARYPRFELAKEKPLSRKERAEVVDMAWRHGVTIVPDEYRKLGIEVLPDQEPVTRTPLSFE